MSFSDSQASRFDGMERAISQRVYLDLLEDNRLTDITEHYDAELKLRYICGNRGSNQIKFIPLLNTIDLDLLRIESIQNKLGNSITLAICDTSSNVLYYQINPSILQKENPETEK